jgi:hypothetical protein
LIDLTLTEGVPVAGLVLAAEDGRSLEGAQVHARLTWGESSEITEHLESVETDADGRFLLSGAPPSRPVTILAEADGRIPSRLVLRTPESTDPVVLRLSRGGTVGGRVYAPDGTPCREGEAWITEVGSVRRIQAARIREDGTFELTGVPVIPEGIRLWAKGCGSAPTTTAALPAATAHGIDVRQDVHLVMPHILQVTFLASDGTTPSSPTSFVVEVASGGQDIFPEAARVVRTVTGPIAAVDLGAETSWSRDQPPALRVVALVGGREYAEADAALVPGGSSTILRGQRARPLAGAVFSETGRPVPKVRVVWTSARLGDGEGGRHESTTDDAGEFRFAALPGPGSLRCHGGADWLDANVEDVAPGSSPLRIELRRAARVQGRLVDPWGAPRPWVLLGLTDPANESFAGHVFHQTGTNADGRFAFDRIDPRRWQVVWVRRPSAEDIPVVDFEVAAGAALDVEWVLRAR